MRAKSRIIIVMLLCFISITSFVRAEKIKISVIDSTGKVVESVKGQKVVLLNIKRIYQPGDRIVISGSEYMTVQIDENVPQSEVYLPEGEMKMQIPFGDGERADRQCWGMDAFSGNIHTITARKTTPERLAVYRNLAVNPSANWKMATSYPHANASSVYRNQSVWSAKAAIDGMTGYHKFWKGKKQNNHFYPNQAWGPAQVDKPWMQIDFGRRVKVNKVIIYLRDYFNHDTHWEEGELLFSDGSTISFTINPKKAGAQEVVFPEKEVSHLRIQKLTNPNKIGWASFAEVEVYGND